jgi:acetolactate synthase-1/2/3 large subunit
MNKNKKKLIGADIIAQAIKDSGIKRVFLYPGGTIAPLLDALISLGVEYVCPRNEQGAGYAAIGASKVSGDAQIVMVTSGPGATNLLTPIADAYYDSVPIIAITGQVGVSDINFEKKVRQTGFQETDSKSIFTPVTKKAVTITSKDDLYNNFMRLISLAKEGRHGPVLIDLPMNIQRESVENMTPNENKIKNSKKSPFEIDHEKIEKIAHILSNAKRPLIIAGNGIYLSDSCKELLNFVEKTGIPTVCSLPGLGSFPSNHSLSYSFIGHTGEFFSNIACHYADILLVLGARLDVRQTGTEIDDFIKNKKIIRVDIDSNELIDGRINADINLNLDLKSFFKFIDKCDLKNRSQKLNDWISKIDLWKDKYNSKQFYQDKTLSSYHILRSVDKLTEGERVLVASGVGTHQQLTARYFTYHFPERVWMTSAGHGTMGFDVPTMIGAMIESKSQYDRALVFVGDGSFQMNIQELATIKNLNLPMKIFVLDNQRLGIVSQFQLLNWPKDESTGDKVNPSFSSIAKSYGLSGYDIASKENLEQQIIKILEDPEPSVVHCHIDVSEDVLPMLLAGQKMNSMHPFKDEV